VITSELQGIISITDILTKSDFVEQPQEVVLSKEFRNLSKMPRAICAEMAIIRLSVLRRGMLWKKCKLRRHISGQGSCLKLLLRNTARKIQMPLRRGSMMLSCHRFLMWGN
jgi:hypothetical protein